MSEQLADLLARVKAANGPDRKIDFAVEEIESIIINPHLVPNYTASIDACVSLVERVLPGWIWQINSPATKADAAYAWIAERLADGSTFSSLGDTPCFALLAAILSALLAKDQSS